MAQPQPYQQPRPALDPRWVTTAFEIHGARIARSLGVVRGVTVHSYLEAGLMPNRARYVQIPDDAHQEAYLIMCARAAQAGANGIIGMRYESNAMEAVAVEVLAYGTAVVFEADPDVK